MKIIIINCLRFRKWINTKIRWKWLFAHVDIENKQKKKKLFCHILSLSLSLTLTQTYQLFSFEKLVRFYSLLYFQLKFFPNKYGLSTSLALCFHAFNSVFLLLWYCIWNEKNLITKSMANIFFFSKSPYKPINWMNVQEYYENQNWTFKRK